MRCSVVRPAELTATELGKWRAMLRSNPSLSSPFLAPDFTLAVGRARTAARVGILEEDAEIVGFFPHERGAFGVGAPIGSGLSDRQGLVHVTGLRWDPMALLAGCDLSVWEFDHLAADQRPFAPHHRSCASSPVVDVSHGYSTYLSERLQSTNGSVAAALRKGRKLEREVGRLRLVLDVHDARLLATLRAWKSAQYRRMGWMDRFAHPETAGIIDTLVQARSQECSGTVSVLYAGDTPVAGHIGLRSTSVLCSWFPTYEVAFAAYSPGLLMLLGMAESAACHGIHRLDLGKGDEGYKRMLQSWDDPVAVGWVERPSVRASFRQAQREGSSRLHDFVAGRPRIHRVAHRAYVRWQRLNGGTGDRWR